MRDEFSLPLRKRGLECLRRLHCLKECKECFLEKIVAGLAPKFVGPNEIIVHEGEEAKALLLLRRGSAEAIESDGALAEEYSDGDTIGSPSLLFSRFVWPHTVRTTDCCEIQALPLKEFRLAVGLHPEEGHKIAKALSIATRSTGLRRGATAEVQGMASPRANSRRRSRPMAVCHAPTGPATAGAGGQTSRRLQRAVHIAREDTASAETGRRRAIFDKQLSGLTNPSMLLPEAAMMLKRGSVPPPTMSRGSSPSPSVLSSLKRRLVENLNEANETGAIPDGKEKADEQQAAAPASTPAVEKGKTLLGPRRPSVHKAPGPAVPAAPAKPVPEETQDSIHTSFQMWAYAAQENDEASLRELAGWLDCIPFFSSMDAFCFERLLPLVEKQSFKLGDKILEEGSVPQALHVIYAGKANVVIDGNIVGSVGPKSLVGERSICRSCSSDVGGLVCCASIVVTTTVLVTIALAREKLMDVFRKDYCVSRQFEELFDRQRKERGEVGLSNTLVFQDADPSFAEQLELTVKLMTVPKGGTIMTKGHVSDEAYFLCKGAVKIIRGRGDMNLIAVKDMKEAVLLGEQNLLGLRREREATVVATAPCTLHMIYLESLKRLLSEFPAESFVFRRQVERGFDEHLKAQEDYWLERRRSHESVFQRGDDGSEMRLIDVTRDSKKSVFPGLATLQGPAGCEENAEDKADSEVQGSDSDSAHGSEGSGSDSSSEAEEPQDTSNMVTVSWDLSLCKDLAECSALFLKKLQAQLRPRLYLAGQVVLRQGEDMGELFVLQKGSCEVSVFGAHLDPLEGPCLIGGTLSLVAPKALTTVAAQETCFVASVSKRQTAAVLDAFPQERRKLLATSSQGFEQLCDSFHQHYVGLAGLERSLAALPCLSGACSDFLSSLASLLSPHLLLPGQVVLDGSTSNLLSDEETKLYILFGGYCHQISDGVVVGTISQKMVFGEMEVFGIEESRGWHMQVKTVELCEVGTLTRRELFEVLVRHPQEKWRFEQLVHNRLEGTVHAQVIGLSFFAGLPSQFLSKVCVLLDRRLCFQDTEVITEGDTGDSMLIVNRGRVEVTYHRIKMGMLWTGKCFGVAQMLGIQHDYHASIRTKGTCHLLLLSRKSLHTLAFAGSERSWMTSLRQRAQATLDSELQLFDKRYREQRRAASKAAADEVAREAEAKQANGDEVPSCSPSCSPSRGPSRSPSAIRLRTPSLRPASGLPSRARSRAQSDAQALIQRVFVAWRRAALRTRTNERSHGRPVTPTMLGAELQELGQPIRFSRGLRRMDLESSTDSIGSPDIWRQWSQRGRLDRWKCVAPPRWLVAVREEIPVQLLALTSEARAGEAHSPATARF